MPHDKTSISSLLERLAANLKAQPFIPHRLLKQRDAQTIGAYLWPRRFRSGDRTGDEERLFEVEPGSQVLARCRWQLNPTEHPTLVIWHGMEGSTASAYMLTTAAKMFRIGFNVVRVNYRNCGGTEHLSPTLYHGGLTADLRAVIDELITRDHLSRLFVAGFSLGGNMVLKLAGEYGEVPPPEVKAVCAVSPSIDLRASTNLIARARNWIYQQDFLRRLKHRIKVKEKLFPDVYDSSLLRGVRSVEQFDNRYVAPHFGFADANDYYAKSSSRPLIGRIRVPTLIIHAKDDPFIPFEPLRDPSIAANPYVLLLATEQGGHVAFVSASAGEERFWAESRLVEFFGMIALED
ncbi:MAG TPA: alpha/beta fold hydrolase [Pyrinomonadaceae bacterium]|nr:alpha/beta fold hydrolase [Pyrinomonadaceae bacterium]